MNIFRVSVVIASFAVVGVGCSEKSSSAPASASPVAKDDAGAPSTPLTPPTPPTLPTPIDASQLAEGPIVGPPAPDAALVEKDDPIPSTNLEARAIQLLTELGAVFEQAGKDCAQLARGLETFLDRHGAELKRLTVQQKALQGDAKQAFDKKMEQLTKPLIEKMMPGMTACSSDPKVTAALERMSDP